MSADTATLSTCLVKMWVITHETSLHTSANLGQRPAFGVVLIMYRKRSLKSHQGKYTNIETEVKTWTHTLKISKKSWDL